jgi:DNA-binding HxlR family transcriptional regulator
MAKTKVPGKKKGVLKKVQVLNEVQAVRFQGPEGGVSTPEVDKLVEEVIGRVADKWTLLLLEVLAQHGVVRFSRLAELVGGISQKMLTQTLRQMEGDGFVTRTVYPVVPPKVEYALTELGLSLGSAFCGVWEWAEKNYEEIERRRAAYRERNGVG